jgi:hypothetical protein
MELSKRTQKTLEKLNAQLDVIIDNHGLVENVDETDLLTGNIGEVKRTGKSLAKLIKLVQKASGTADLALQSLYDDKANAKGKKAPKKVEEVASAGLVD